MLILAPDPNERAVCHAHPSRMEEGARLKHDHYDPAPAGSGDKREGNPNHHQLHSQSIKSGECMPSRRRTEHLGIVWLGPLGFLAGSDARDLKCKTSPTESLT